MTFPQTALPIKVELQINSAWTDITSDVRGDQQIRITRGRSDEGQQVDTSRCSFTLDNNSGNYSPKNPNGLYYGRIGRNTPVRVSVLTGTPYLDLPGATSDYVETPDAAALDITGDLDVRFDASFMNWVPTVLSGTLGTVEMIGKFQGLTQKSWFLGTRAGRLYFEWSTDGSNSLSASSTIEPVVPGSGRLAVRVTLDVDNGSGGNTVRFYTAASLDSPWTQLGDPVTQTGTTSIFNSTSPVRVGFATNFSFTLPYGRVHSAEIRNGLWGTVVAQPYFSQQAVGTTSFADSAGRTWTLAGNTSITNRQTRFVGEVTSWPVRWETKYDVVVNVEASGILRRITQGASPTRSAMYREFTNPSRSGIVGYWPMEDDVGATTFASALPTQPSMSVPSSGVSRAAYSDWEASAPLPTYTSGTSRVRLTAYTATNYIFTRLFALVPAGGVTGTDRLFGFTTTGTARTWSLFVNTAGSLDLRAYDADGVQLFASGFSAFAINGVPRHIGVELTQNGSNVDWSVLVVQIDDSTLGTALATNVTGTLVGATAGAATEVRIGQDGLLNGTAIGHVAVASSSTAYANTGNAMLAWATETADNRIFRLGNEEGFPAYPMMLSSQEMGVQGRQNLVELLREAEAADEGILCEGRSYLGLRLRNHTSLNNQLPALTLDYTGSSALVTPLEPTDDDQTVRNDITVARTDGSSSRLTLDTGTLSTLPPPSGVGRYTDSVTLNLADDSQALDHAGWRLHLGTWDETRYPVVRMVLAKVPSLLESAAAVDVGDRIQITNPPSWLPPDTIDLMVQGYSETLDQFTWNIDFNCTPCAPYDVAWVGNASSASAAREWAWYDTDGSSLAEDLTSTETDVDVLTTTTGPLWTPNVRDMPFDWRVGGEVMTVTAPHSLINANPFFDTDASGWTAAAATITRSQTYVMPHPRATASLRITPDGVTASGGANGTITAAASITPGATYVASMWVFSVNGWSDLRPSIDWYDSAGVFLSSGLGTATVVSSSVWTYIEQTLTAPANASRAIVRARHGGTPATSDVYYVWGVRITRSKSSWLYDTFTRTSSNSWGTSDSGLAWNTVGGGSATDYTLSGTYASHVLSTVDTSRRTAVTAVNPDFDIYCDLTTSAAATGDSLYGAVTARMLDSSNMYVLRVEFTTGNAIVAAIRKIVADVQTQLATYTLPFTHVAGTFVRVRFQGQGTTLRARAWRTTSPEPSAWHMTATDSAITAANQIGTRSIRATGNTNTAAVEIRYDNYEVVDPQTYTVTRSANRVVKAQSAGASVALAYPAYLAL